MDWIKGCLPKAGELACSWTFGPICIIYYYEKDHPDLVYARFVLFKRYVFLYNSFWWRHLTELFLPDWKKRPK